MIRLSSCYWNICFIIKHGSLNVTTEHHPTMRYLIYNCHSKVMSNSPKMGHLPIPVFHYHVWLPDEYSNMLQAIGKWQPQKAGQTSVIWSLKFGQFYPEGHPKNMKKTALVGYGRGSCITQFICDCDITHTGNKPIIHGIYNPGIWTHDHQGKTNSC